MPCHTEMLTRRAPHALAILPLLLSTATAQRERPVWMKPLVEKFDDNKDGRVDGRERAKALEWIREEMEKNPPRQRRRRGEEKKPWCEPRNIDRSSVEHHKGKSLFDTDVVHTMFLDFPQEEWDEEMKILWRTKICTPATLTVKGKKLKKVGVRFRGTSSFFSVLDRPKKSLSLTLDWRHKGQELEDGLRSFNLLSAHADPSFMRTVLFSKLASQYVKAGKAGFVHLVINGESWGLYILEQSLNKEFTDAEFGTRKGARWKINPNFDGEAALEYRGKEIEDYEDQYLLKSATKKSKAWKRLIKLCKLLNRGARGEIERELPKLLDIDHTLMWLAVDNVLMDGDGYHYRGSDYALYLHPDGRFYPLFRDNNEAFSYGGGPGGFGRNEDYDYDAEKERNKLGLEPLALADEPRAALCHAMFHIPKWRWQYLENCYKVADEALDWEEKVGPMVEKWRAMIEPIVKLDDKALYGHEEFVKALDQGTERKPGLKKFFDERRKFLMECDELRWMRPRKPYPEKKPDDKKPAGEKPANPKTTDAGASDN